MTAPQDVERALIAQLKRTDSLRTDGLRRDALAKLIEYAHSPNQRVKNIVALRIKDYITLVPELEDDAINAVYDLCEDQDQMIRLAGYKAISEVSKVDRKWVKRNADVLIQLLQSDDQKELDAVKQALRAHLDLDPRATFGVFCDQIVPQDEPMDAEEQAIRDHLRTLVIAYLRDESKRGNVPRNCKLPDVEQHFVAGIKRAIAKLGPADIETLVREVLLTLPLFEKKERSKAGDDLLRAVLERAKASLKEDVTGASALPLLKLADDLVSQRHLAHPLPLLQFYLSSILPPSALSALSPDTRVYALSNLNTLLAACDAALEGMATPDDPPRQKIETAQRQAIEATHVVVDSLVQTGKVDSRSWDVVRTLLKGCKRRQDQPQPKWTPSPELVAPLKKLQTMPGTPEDVQELIRALVPPPARRVINVATRTPAPAPASANGAPASRKRKQDSPPPRPASALEIDRAPKRQKPRAHTNQGAPSPAASLLDRMGGTPRSAPATPTPQAQRMRQDSARGRPREQEDAGGGLKIRGAAEREKQDAPVPATTLIGRMGGGPSLAARLAEANGAGTRKR